MTEIIYEIDNHCLPESLTLKDDERVRFIFTDQNCKSTADEIVTIYSRFTLHKSSRLQLCIALFQAQECTINFDFDLQGNAAEVDVVVLYGLSGKQRLKIISRQQHVGKDTKSSFIVRGIAMDQASVTYEGLIAMLPGSLQAKAMQDHTTIVLGDQTKIISVPSIEVLHHDVQCFHAAAVGQFQKQQLWYLQSRGFEKKIAISMLIRSFFSEHIDRFSDKEKLLESLCQKIL
jgi:Fe-S cluster assembly protein SufD